MLKLENFTDILDQRVAILRDLELALDPEHVYKAQGVRSGTPSAAVRAATSALLPEARRLIEPTISCRVLTVGEVGPKGVAFTEGHRFQGRLPSVIFGHGSHVFAAVCTAGSALDRRVKDLSQAGDIVEAFILDAAGTAAVVELKGIAHALAWAWAQQHSFKAGMAAGPANESWPLEDQRVFARMLPLDEIGVELLETLLFRPNKTASLAIGIGERVVEGKDCDYCAIKATCQFR